MDLFNEEKAKEFSALGFKNQRKNLRKLPQVKVKNVDLKRDSSRKALAAGKRISKTGKIYWETRSNRSDKVGSKL